MEAAHGREWNEEIVRGSNPRSQGLSDERTHFRRGRRPHRPSTAPQDLAFVAETLAGRRVHCVGATGSPLGEVWQLRAPLVDIVATRLPAPVGRRDMLDWSRSQQRPLVLARVRAPQPGVAELLLDVAFSEGAGTALLTDMQFAVLDCRNKFLLGPHPGDVNLKLMPDGLVPTLTSPGNPRAVARAIFDVESRFADFLRS